MKYEHRQISVGLSRLSRFIDSHEGNGPCELCFFRGYVTHVGWGALRLRATHGAVVDCLLVSCGPNFHCIMFKNTNEEIIECYYFARMVGPKMVFSYHPVYG
jgi:hypothetical protein